MCTRSKHALRTIYGLKYLVLPWKIGSYHRDNLFQLLSRILHALRDQFFIVNDFYDAISNFFIFPTKTQ